MKLSIFIAGKMLCVLHGQVFIMVEQESFPGELSCHMLILWLHFNNLNFLFAASVVEWLRALIFHRQATSRLIIVFLYKNNNTYLIILMKYHL